MCDAGHHSERLAQGPVVDAGGHLIGEIAFEQLRDAACELDDLDAALGGGVGRPEVTSSEELLALLPRGVRHREGIFNLLFVLAFVVAILVLLVTSGLGLAERRREIARKGGASVPGEKRSFAKDRDLAASAGRKGGEASRGGGRSRSRES